MLAPSGHNTQPWLFEVRESAVDLHADRTRALPVVDPEDRELTMSCAAALFHLRVAWRRFGYEGAVETFPDPASPDLLARVRPGGRRKATEEDKVLFRAIPARRTSRLPFEEKEVPQHVLSALRIAASEEGAWLRVAEGRGEREAVAGLIAEGDRTQWADRRFRRELAAWTHSNRSRSRDGIPGYAMGFGDLMSLAGPVVIRTFDMGNGRAARDRQLAEGSPVIAVLGTEGDVPPDWLAAGQALARVLLRARAEGIFASYLNQPIEVPELRPELASILRVNGFPQLLLRMGYGPESRPTPRRPAEEMTLEGRPRTGHEGS